MMDYKNRSLKKEMLDQKNIPFEDIVLNMKELEFINSHLGGHSITVSGFKNLLKNKKQVSVCEIGCGGGNNLKAINKFSKRNHIISSFTGIDINKECIAFAKENMQLSQPSLMYSPTANIKFIVSDYKDINFTNEKPDIIFSSLFCHHFSENELIEMLDWMKKNSKTGFFINDLHRHPVAYHFIKNATKLFSKSYLVKNDAPLSVLRGFKKNEWKNIFQKAGVKNYSIKWKWAFRYLIIVSNQQNQ
jgi:2-polyprenyl-3-methyl-5-hydroxy-6-metoxy-1,4-benzoquinol methylase